MSNNGMILNDMMAQCSQKLIKVSDEERENRIKEINSCHHLFVKLRERPELEEYHDSVVVECVYCGVTNKYNDLEKTLVKYRHSLEYYLLNKFHNVNIEYNDSTIESQMMEEIKKDNQKLNMLSNGIIRSFHPGLLFQLAKKICPNGTNEEIFEIMQELNELETTKEKNQLCFIDDADELVERFYENKGRVLKK